jgi:hypothetical protein
VAAWLARPPSETTPHLDPRNHKEEHPDDERTDPGTCVASRYVLRRPWFMSSHTPTAMQAMLPMFARTTKRQRRRSTEFRGTSEILERCRRGDDAANDCTPGSAGCETAPVCRDLERAVKQARKRLAEDYGSREALAILHDAERQLAAARREAWAEPLGLGVIWDVGAPLPHLLSSGAKAVLLCRAAVVDADWDGTYVTVVSPSDPTPADLIEFTFVGCHATRFGGPSDEALHGHPLYSRGLNGYGPHLVHNSKWIAQQEAIDSVHQQHQSGWHERLHHYFFVFHDEMFEAIARSVNVRSVRGTMAESLINAAMPSWTDPANPFSRRVEVRLSPRVGTGPNALPARGYRSDGC